MKKLRILAMILVGIMVIAIPCAAFAAVKDDAVSPLYLYTRRVNATLAISDSGAATCCGFVQASQSGSSISVTITLYRQSGTSWSKVTSWSASDDAQILEIEKNRHVSAGTYKVELTGSVTNPEGKKESISATSAQITYSKK